MAKYYGAIGYAETTETAPGVWEEVIVEYNAIGDVIKNNRRLERSDNLLDNINVSNSFSIVVDSYINDHFFAIRYISWANARWKVTDISVERPRLILTIGGIYNGPTPGTP